MARARAMSRCISSTRAARNRTFAPRGCARRTRPPSRDRRDRREKSRGGLRAAAARCRPSAGRRSSRRRGGNGRRPSRGPHRRRAPAGWSARARCLRSARRAFVRGAVPAITGPDTTSGGRGRGRLRRRRRAPAPDGSRSTTRRAPRLPRRSRPWRRSRRRNRSGRPHRAERPAFPSVPCRNGSPSRRRPRRCAQPLDEDCPDELLGGHARASDASNVTKTMPDEAESLGDRRLDVRRRQSEGDRALGEIIGRMRLEGQQRARRAALLGEDGASVRGPPDGRCADRRNCRSRIPRVPVLAAASPDPWRARSRWSWRPAILGVSVRGAGPAAPDKCLSREARSSVRMPQRSDWGER